MRFPQFHRSCTAAWPKIGTGNEIRTALNQVSPRETIIRGLQPFSHVTKFSEQKADNASRKVTTNLLF